MKKELRKAILTERSAIPAEQVKVYSDIITEKVMHLPEFQKAHTIMLYLDFRNEVQTERLVQVALGQGKRVVVPITDQKNVRLIPSEIINYPEDLTHGTWGILEPRQECIRPVEVKDIDLVLVPGVGFDKAGNRLGYGGGYYDRFTPLLRPEVKLIALAFDLQIKELVYPEAHDRPVDMVITEQQTLYCNLRDH